MSCEVGSFTVPGSTGNTTIVLDGSFTPALIEFDAGPRTSTNETDVRRSSGWTDGSRQRAVSIYADGTVKGTRQSNSYSIMHWVNVSGTLTKKFSASIVSMTSGEFVLNFDVVDNTYQVYFKAFS